MFQVDTHPLFSMYVHGHARESRTYTHELFRYVLASAFRFDSLIFPVAHERYAIHTGQTQAHTP